MNWKCPACGAEDNTSDLLRCSCGYESSEKPCDVKTMQPEPVSSLTELTLQEPSKNKKIIVKCISFLISCFFIVSALGWIFATYLMMTGRLRKDAIDFYHSLNFVDHIVRAGQVGLVVVASVFLILSRRVAAKLFFICLMFSLAAFAFRGKWGISFLPLVITAAAYGYVYLLNKYGYLR